MVKTLRSKLPLSIDPYDYMFGDIKIHGFSLMAGDGETQVATVETDDEIEVGSDKAIDNYLQIKADAQLIMIAVNNHYQMVNVLRNVVEWDSQMMCDCNRQSIPFHISIEIQSILNQIDVSNPHLPREEGCPGEPTGDLSTLPGI